MKTLPHQSIDFCLTDPPYGTTQCKWDAVIPFAPMWCELNRVVKLNGAVALFGSEPFSSNLRISNLKNFNHDLIWKKQKTGSPFHARKKHLKIHETISLFYRKQPVYSPQFTYSKPYLRKGDCRVKTETQIPGNQTPCLDRGSVDGRRFPVSVLEFSNESMNRGSLHPTQKPVALLEYLIKTYTLEGETVLDFTMGSGSTGVACKNLNRKFIGIEKDEKYFQIACERLGYKP